MPLFPNEAAETPCDDCGEAQGSFGDYTLAHRLSELWDTTASVTQS